MQITYLNCNGKKKLFSFTQHDYRSEEIDSTVYSLDGGITTDPDSYIRKSGSGTLEQEEVKDLIKEIREVFNWGKNYNKDGTRTEKTEYALLKDLDSSHICGILSYFNNNSYKICMKNDSAKSADDELPTTSKKWHILHEIFIQELDYRVQNNVI